MGETKDRKKKTKKENKQNRTTNLKIIMEAVAVLFSE